MEFQKYYDMGSRTEKEDKRHPLIGYVIVDEPYDCSDCNFYPNHEVFGKAIPGRYPLYYAYQPHYDFEEDERYFVPTFVGLVAIGGHAFGHVDGIAYDGKEEFSNPVHIYEYELKRYLEPSPEHHYRIELIEPFRLDEEGRLLGYGMTQEELMEHVRLRKEGR